LSAWTTALHRLGYLSGVYGSSRSGIIDLAREYSGHTYAMPDAIYDALWNGSKNVADAVYHRKSWPRNHRLHQFSGNDTQTYGGVTIDIDKDYLNIALPAPGGWRDRIPRLFGAVALGGLLFSLGHNSVFHGVLYALLPMVEKGRSPSMASFIFHFGLCVLIAYGIDGYRSIDTSFIRRTVSTLLGFSALIAIAVLILTATKTPLAWTVGKTIPSRPRVCARY